MAPTKRLEFDPADGRGLNFAPPFSDHVVELVLDANQPKTTQVPADANYVVFSATNEFRVRANGGASIPSADLSDGSAAVLNPSQRMVSPGDELSLIAPFACRVTLEYYL